MQLVYILLFIAGLLLVITAFKLPGSFSSSEKKRKLFKRMRRQEEKEEIFKP